MKEYILCAYCRKKVSWRYIWDFRWVQVQGAFNPLALLLGHWFVEYWRDHEPCFCKPVLLGVKKNDKTK